MIGTIPAELRLAHYLANRDKGNPFGALPDHLSSYGVPQAQRGPSVAPSPLSDFMLQSRF